MEMYKLRRTLIFWSPKRLELLDSLPRVPCVPRVPRVPLEQEDLRPAVEHEPGGQGKYRWTWITPTKKVTPQKYDEQVDL